MSLPIKYNHTHLKDFYWEWVRSAVTHSFKDNLAVGSTGIELLHTESQGRLPRTPIFKYRDSIEYKLVPILTIFKSNPSWDNIETWWGHVNAGYSYRGHSYHDYVMYGMHSTSIPRYGTSNRRWGVYYQAAPHHIFHGRVAAQQVWTPDEFDTYFTIDDENHEISIDISKGGTNKVHITSRGTAKWLSFGLYCMPLDTDGNPKWHIDWDLAFPLWTFFGDITDLNGTGELKLENTVLDAEDVLSINNSSLFKASF